jgi:NADP-dependent aldehyde dehydrogenase
MNLRGTSQVAGAFVPESGLAFDAFEARTGAVLPPRFHDARDADVDAAGAAACAAAEELWRLPRQRRAALLRAIAQQIEALGDELLERAAAETALATSRLQNERGRTLLQLRRFADLVDDGAFLEVRAPKPELRKSLVPLGPVAVFPPSNFPLAYSVAGGDTASALAAGCPVVVKAHPFHPGTSELTARAVARAVSDCGLPPGCFSLLHGLRHEVGRRLVQHPAIQAVGFTGSFRGGRALLDYAQARRQPIPVFAEMGSANPVFVLPQALRERGEAIAQMLAESVLLGAGQFCTCPGLLFVPEGKDGDGFVSALAAKMRAAPPGVMVHNNIAQGFEDTLGELEGIRGLRKIVPRALFEIDAEGFLRAERLHDEVYGPCTVVVRVGEGGVLAVARALHGHLTATVHGSEQELNEGRELFDVLVQKAGRIVCNGVPTGVEVSPAMQHGGPWPASSDSRFTAVGDSAVLRWLRPVCWQNAPEGVVPAELRQP